MIGAVFSPDGKRLITRAMGFPSKVWDVATWRHIMTLYNWIGGFSPNGKKASLQTGKEIIIIPLFPWKENEYPGNSGMPLEERIELYKRNCWEQLEETEEN